MNHKAIKILISILILSFSVKAQDLPLYNQYHFNPYLLNPAVTGSNKHPVTILTDRHQWMGISHAPQTQALSCAIRLGDYEGVGATFFSDRNGAMKKIGINLTYAHHIVLSLRKKLKLSFGGSFTGYQLNIDHGTFGDLETSDPLIFQSTKSLYIPDAAFGTYIYSPTYFAGISVANVLESKISFNKDADSYDHNIRTIFISGGYRLPFYDIFSYDPSALIRTTTDGKWQLDINGRIYYDNKHWIGYSFRTNRSFLAMVGFKVKNLRFGYAYEYNPGALHSLSHGTHELMVSYNIGERDDGYICPAYY